MPKKTKTWIVIADGARVRFFLNHGPGSGLEPVAEKEWQTARMPTRELGTDEPGRTFESADGSRHMLTPRADWHRHEEEKFAHKVAKVLDEAAVKGHFDALVLVAPPRALGDLRAKLDKHVLAKIKAELPKDLTNVPQSQLPEHLAEVVRL